MTMDKHFQSLLANASTGSKQKLVMPEEYLKMGQGGCSKKNQITPHKISGKLIKVHLSGADVRYISEFYSEEESLEFFNLLTNSLFSESSIWDRFGKGRFVAQWSHPANMRYIFSDVEYIAHEFPGWIDRVRLDIIALLSPVYGADQCAFNYCVGNYYADGQAGVNWHTDSESQIVPGCPIACVSFGAERIFSLARIFNASEQINIPLESGSVIVMAGDCQRNYLHSIGKEENRRGRFSLTFRVNR